MAIVGATTDYSGRTRDLLIFDTGGFSTNTEKAAHIGFGRVSKYCTGTQKLIQRYAISLLTNLGSQEPYPDFGTDFLSKVQSSNSNITNVDIKHIFNFANLKVVDAFRAYQSETEGIPTDEQLDTAILDDFTVVGDTVNFSIIVYTMARDEIVFVLPMPITDN